MWKKNGKKNGNKGRGEGWRLGSRWHSPIMSLLSPFQKDKLWEKEERAMEIEGHTMSEWGGDKGKGEEKRLQGFWQLRRRIYISYFFQSKTRKVEACDGRGEGEGRRGEEVFGGWIVPSSEEVVMAGPIYIIILFITPGDALIDGDEDDNGADAESPTFWTFSQGAYH